MSKPHQNCPGLPHQSTNSYAVPSKQWVNTLQQQQFTLMIPSGNVTRTVQVFHSSHQLCCAKQAVSEYPSTTTIHSNDSSGNVTRTVQVFHSSQQLCCAKQTAKHVSCSLTTTMAHNWWFQKCQSRHHILENLTSRTNISVHRQTIQYNELQLYCLCEEKFAFWLVIYI